LAVVVPLEQVTEKHFDKYFGMNVKGTLFPVQKGVPLMHQGGAIVMVDPLPGLPRSPPEEGQEIFVDLIL
jgi:NAD(P)-dependent dehydrogenase (short-subunit alcohol dehydrogenase family)